MIIWCCCCFDSVDWPAIIAANETGVEVAVEGLDFSCISSFACISLTFFKSTISCLSVAISSTTDLSSEWCHLTTSEWLPCPRDGQLLAISMMSILSELIMRRKQTGVMSETACLKIFSQLNVQKCQN
ncbi:hypothetical protein BpHYR1_007188 [Brachionus plicatilis]|uniref:Uncharacterized protein n=1 Tax=Brachionus plicatilis TaxID=10195 RepID=A0A3M7QYJ1_BRAPC|nr:hypothetical protein BpHYR1_007188 [Brachionus plicatilis]